MNNNDVPALVESVKVALRIGKLAEGEQLCLELISLDPDNLVALFTLATLAANRGETTAAIQYMRDVVDRDPSSWKPHEVLCRLLLQVGDFTAAIQAGNRACQLEPNAAEAHSILGACYIEDGNFEQALAQLSRAISLQPSYMPAHHHLGVVLRRLRRDTEAEAEFRKAIQLDPIAPQPYVQLAKLLRDQGRSDEATSCVKSALEAASLQPKNRLELASSLMSVGLMEEAEQPLRDELRSKPESAEALNRLGRALHQMGRFPEAIECFDRLISQHPNRAQAYFDLVQSRKVTAADIPMLQAMTALLAQTGQSTGEARHLHYALGKSHEDLAHYIEAFDHYKAANQLTAATVSPRRLSEAERRAGLSQIMGTFKEEFFARHTELGSESETPTLIVGMIRSGTTLVEQILSSHPCVTAGGEQTMLYQSADLQLRSEAEIVAKAPAIRDAYLRLLLGVGSKARLVTDKMPLNFEALGLFHLLFPRGRIIHCRRDPADTCVSIYTTPVVKPADIGHDPETIASYYSQYLLLMAHWNKVLPRDRLHHIDYEELVAHRESEVRNLLDFCGLEWDVACLNHESKGGAILTPSTWQVRQPIYNSSVGRWQNYKAQLPEFGQLSKPT